MKTKDKIDVMIEVARRAATDAGVSHPDDLAASMITAIEAASLTLQVIQEQE